jgi:hypothetical protein
VAAGRPSVGPTGLISGSGIGRWAGNELEGVGEAPGIGVGMAGIVPVGVALGDGAGVGAGAGPPRIGGNMNVEGGIDVRPSPAADDDADDGPPVVVSPGAKVAVPLEYGVPDVAPLEYVPLEYVPLEYVPPSELPAAGPTIVAAPGAELTITGDACDP